MRRMSVCSIRESRHRAGCNLDPADDVINKRLWSSGLRQLDNDERVTAYGCPSCKSHAMTLDAQKL
jgi:hypothetical protein